MKLPKRGQKGFTLIELLIVVAILGVLAAVIIPNVGRFLGRGETEARKTEKQNVSLAVTSMMVDNLLSAIPNPVSTTPTNAMGAFPDATSVCASANKLKDVLGVSYVASSDLNGYILYQHDGKAGDVAALLTNYVQMATSKFYYTVETNGTVHQWADAAKTGGEFTD